MATQAGIPFTDMQLLEKGLQLIRNTRYFEMASTKWNAGAHVGKTWENFKLHFQNEQRVLKEVRGLNMQQAGYHHANSLATQIRNDIQCRDV